MPKNLTIMNFLFLPRRYLQASTGVRKPANKYYARRQWVVSRGLCVYRLFVLGDVPFAERKNALALRIKQCSPFPNMGSYVVWSGDKAQVWIWDEDVRRLAAEKSDAKGAAVVPETLLQPLPTQDSIRLIACSEGFEGQIWEGGVLLEDHWWAAEPDQQDWSRFLAANDLKMEVPTPEQFVLLARPWGKRYANVQFVVLRHQKLWISTFLGLIVFILIWQIASFTKWQHGVRDMTMTVANLSKEVQPILSAREQAFAVQQAIKKVAAVNPYPSQLELMAATFEQLAGKKVKLIEWHYKGGTLSFTLEGDNMDPSVFVKNFQAMSVFNDVTADKNASLKQLVMNMKVAR